MSFISSIKHGFNDSDKFSPRTIIKMMHALKPAIQIGLVLSTVALAYIAYVSWICFCLTLLIGVFMLWAGARSGIVQGTRNAVFWAAKASAQFTINSWLAHDKEPVDEADKEVAFMDCEDVLTERMPTCVDAVFFRVECETETKPDGTGGKYRLTLHPGNWITVWAVRDDVACPLSSGYVDLETRKIHTLYDVNPDALLILTEKLFAQLDAIDAENGKAN